MKRDTKDNILRAAIKVFAQKGYKAATVREIGKEAGAANISAVTYHFQGKENLYRAVLEFMFEDADRLIPEIEIDVEMMTPTEKLRFFILMYMRIIYIIDSDLDADLSSIFSKEVTHPSPFLSEMVQTYLTPGSIKLQAILEEFMGEHVPRETIRHCEDSIMGQIYYQFFAWPLIIRLHPNQPQAHTQIDKLAQHIFTFTIGGLRAIKETYHR